MAGAGVKIRPDTATEIDSFANINNLASFVLHQVATRFGWKSLKYALEMFRCGQHIQILACGLPGGFL